MYTFSLDWIWIAFRGQEQSYTMKLALTQVGNMMYELIEPVQGPNTYEEFLNNHGEGLHHLAHFVDDIDVAIEQMERAGYSLLQSGRGFGTNDDGAYAYFETEDALGHIIEAIEMPPEMPPPERTFPE